MPANQRRPLLLSLAGWVLVTLLLFGHGFSLHNRLGSRARMLARA